MDALTSEEARLVRQHWRRLVDRSLRGEGRLFGVGPRLIFDAQNADDPDPQPAPRAGDPGGRPAEDTPQ